MTQVRHQTESSTCAKSYGLCRWRSQGHPADYPVSRQWVVHR